MLESCALEGFSITHPFRLLSQYSRASRYFRTDRLRRVFTYAAMYLVRPIARSPSHHFADLSVAAQGMSPFDALGTYSLLQYTELAEGIWYPLGGFQTVLAALQRVAERKGAVFRLSTPVERVLLSDDGSAATGVVLKGGEELHADVVVINADLIWSLNNLFEPTSYSRKLAKKPVSCSSISFYWSMDRVVKDLGSHTIFLADEYKESFDSIFRDHEIPNEPSFYVNKPSLVDPT